MTEEDPPKESYEAYQLRKLLHKTTQQTETMDDQNGIIMPTTALAKTLKPLLRDDLKVVAPCGEKRVMDTNGNVFDTENIDVDKYVDLRLTDKWPVHGDTDAPR